MRTVSTFIVLLALGAAGDRACETPLAPENVLLQAGGSAVQRAASSGGSQAAGDLSRDDDPVAELDSSCNATCLVDGEEHSCSARVQWAFARVTNATDRLAAAVKLVNDECLGQCICNTTDFPGSLWDLPCHTAHDGEQCFQAVEWARTDGIRLHPEWYDNLTSGSTFEEFQFCLYKNSWAQCHEPCDMCHTAVPGEECYDELRAAALDNEFPSNFSFEEMQALWSRNGSNTTCPRPCAHCRTAAPGDSCHIGVTHAMKYLIASHPDWYPGLTTNSSFEDFQELLHTRNLERCAMPCRGHPGPPTWQNQSATPATADVMPTTPTATGQASQPDLSTQ